jgi:hypothetical protein
MANTPTSDFARALRMVTAKAMKDRVPKDFMVAQLEIVKTDMANRYLNEESTRQAEALAEDIARNGGKIIRPPSSGN